MKCWTRCPQCGVDVSGDCYTDVEGDAGVIGGLHRFIAIEDVEQQCECTWTASDTDIVEQHLVEDYEERMHDEY